MIEVSKIERKGNRIKISFLQSEPLLLSRETFNKFPLYVDQTITEKFLDDLVNFEQLNLAKQAALRLLAIRNHSSLELRKKLLQKKIKPDMVEKILEYLVDANLLNDEKFAREYASELSKRKHFGSSRIKLELRKKGIEDTIVKDIMKKSSADLESEKKNLELAASKYLKHLSKKLSPREKQKLVNFLYRKGFSWDLISLYFRSFDGG
jgi:regulatory protein